MKSKQKKKKKKENALNNDHISQECVTHKVLEVFPCGQVLLAQYEILNQNCTM